MALAVSHLPEHRRVRGCLNLQVKFSIINIEPIILGLNQEGVRVEMHVQGGKNPHEISDCKRRTGSCTL